MFSEKAVAEGLASGDKHRRHAGGRIRRPWDSGLGYRWVMVLLTEAMGLRGGK